jgi:hypothetical protein
MRDIAEFRAHEKYDPEDYARRTVEKAKLALDTGTARTASVGGSTGEQTRGVPEH